MRRHPGLAAQTSPLLVPPCDGSRSDSRSRPPIARSRDTFLDFLEPCDACWFVLPPLSSHSISTCEQVITEWGGLAYPPTDPTSRPGLRTPLSTVFQVESSLGLHPSEVSLRSCRRALSGRAVLRACSSDLAVGLLRGFELSVPHRADLTATRLRVSNGSVHTRACCSHVRAVAPLLVVSPLRGLP